MNLRDLDLNLLVVLRQLLKERHVSRAAEQLGMSQPAVSRALQRLRGLFADPLPVRTPDGYVPSARAEALLPGLEQLIGDIERLIAGPTFAPEASTQTVRFYFWHARFHRDPMCLWIREQLRIAHGATGDGDESAG